MHLYKYLSPERIDVLQNLHVRFTQPYALNDPFESFPGIIQKEKKWFRRQFEKMIEAEMDDIQFEAGRQQHKRFREQHFDEYYCHWTDKDSLFEQALSIILRTSVVSGYLSLSAVNDNILMWSHYANNHEGYVLGFDGDHEYLGPRAYEMNYSTVRPYLNPT